MNGLCNCSTPRASTSHRQGKGSKGRALANDPRVDESIMAQPGALVASANSGRHRPVLPRPSTPPHGQSSHPHFTGNPAGTSHLRPNAHQNPYGRGPDGIQDAAGLCRGLKPCNKGLNGVGGLVNWQALCFGWASSANERVIKHPCSGVHAWKAAALVYHTGGSVQSCAVLCRSSCSEVGLVGLPDLSGYCVDCPKSGCLKAAE